MPTKKKIPQNNHQKRERTLFFVTIFLTTLFASLWLLKDYLSIVALSVVFAIVVHPLYTFLKEKAKLGRAASTLITMILSFFLIIMPIILSANLFIQELGQIIAEALINTDQTIAEIDSYVQNINGILAGLPFVDMQISVDSINQLVRDINANLSTYVLDRVVDIGTSSVQFIVNFFVFLILVYFAIPVLPDLRDYVLKLSPLEDKVDEMYIDRMIALIVSTIKSIFIIALAQGLIGGLFLWIAGVEYILTFTIMMFILSIIPIIGTGFVTVPIGIYMLLQGNIAAAAIILLGQLIFVSNIDNILRAELLSRDTSLHPAIMLLGIFGGLQMFGALGLIYGPLIIILFLTSLEIYMKHYKY